MNNPTTTFVSAFYNIRDKESNAHRNGEDHFCNVNSYLEASRKLFKGGVNLILFTQPDLVETFKKIKEEEGNTTAIIIEKSYEQLSLWPLLETFEKNDKVWHVPNNDYKKFTPLYYLIISQKLYFVEEIIQTNPFNTKNFAWIDIRGLNLSPVSSEKWTNLESYTNPLGKVRICCMCYTTKSEIENKKEYYKYNRGKIAAPFFVGNKFFLTKFINLFKEELLEVLSNGGAVTEEQIYGIVVGKNPSVFDLYYGDYHDAISNIDKLNSQQSVYLCTRSFGMAYSENNHNAVLSMGMELINFFVPEYWSIKNYNKSKLSIDYTLYDIISKTYIASFYTAKYDISIKCYMLLINYGVELAKQNKHFLLNNFSYLRGKIDDFEYIQNLLTEL